MGERVVPYTNSLVKYNVPHIVSLINEKEDRGRTKKQVNYETEEALNCILPAREWIEDGVLWRQKVSSEPVTRTDVIKLGEQLDLRLRESRAKMLGICPIRRELFTQCFDELVRQVTLNCVEQGLLLLRVRDEMRMTCRTYQVLYESAIAFGLRKLLQVEKEQNDENKRTKELNEENLKLLTKIEELEQRARQTDRRNTEIRLAEQKKYEEQLQFLKRTNQQLKLQLEGIINPKK